MSEQQSETKAKVFGGRWRVKDGEMVMVWKPRKTKRYEVKD